MAPLSLIVPWFTARWRHCYFQTPSRHLPGTLQTPFKHVPNTLQTCSRHPPDTLWTPSRQTLFSKTSEFRILGFETIEYLNFSNFWATHSSWSLKQSFALFQNNIYSLTDVWCKYCACYPFLTEEFVEPDYFTGWKTLQTILLTLWDGKTGFQGSGCSVSVDDQSLHLVLGFLLELWIFTTCFSGEQGKLGILALVQLK